MRKQNPPFSHVQLEQLIAEKCNGLLSAQGAEELERIVSGSPQARALYWECLSVHAGLSWMHSSKLECDLRLADMEDDVVGSDRVATEPKSPLLGVWAFWLPLALAASLLFALWTIGQQSLEPDRPSDLAISAAIGDNLLGTLEPLSAGSHWSFGTPGDRNRQSFKVGDTLWLNEGAVELRLTNGTLVQLEAPLILGMDAMNCARVLRGRITVDVPEGEDGFVVETAAAEVVDLGTTFSVDVAESGDTDVIVFQGKVDVNLSQHQLSKGGEWAAAIKRLHRGEAVRVSEDGTMSRIVNVRRTDFSSSGSGTPLIKEVRDNIVREETIKYYEIIAGGMGEDAQVFVDREYQWNGVDAQGIPAHLLGGDYVKTFNDDKVAQNFVITVTVEQPAEIYLLVDDRLEQTEWLEEQFEDTGDNIGVDEGPHIPNDVRVIAEGPGESIDQVHSIWKCREIVRNSITIGPSEVLSPELRSQGIKAGLNMFGIVAVPAPSKEL